jgi:DNA/RNA endonuclease YhcR with UshA esterase domain
MHLQKEELAVVVLLLFAAIASVVLLLVSAGAPGNTYSSNSKPGDDVCLEGLLLHKEKTGNGGHQLLTVKAGTEMVTVFVSATSEGNEAADAAKPGNTVFVQGKVQDYKGQREIAATSISIR